MKTLVLASKTLCNNAHRPVGQSVDARPWAAAMLDVLRRRGRNYGLLTLYEESRLNARQ